VARRSVRGHACQAVRGQKAEAVKGTFGSVAKIAESTVLQGFEVAKWGDIVEVLSDIRDSRMMAI